MKSSFDEEILLENAIEEFQFFRISFDAWACEEEKVVSLELVFWNIWEKQL
jgi:hypothetical protein